MRLMRGSLVSPNARVARLVAAFAAVPAVVLGVIVLLTAGVIAGVVVLVVVAAALGAWARVAGDRRALARKAHPLRDSRLGLLPKPAIGKRIRGDIDDAHQDRRRCKSESVFMGERDRAHVDLT